MTTDPRPHTVLTAVVATMMFAGIVLTAVSALADATLDVTIEDKLEELGLPPIDKLGAGSDFTVFMKPEVPHEIRTLALRKLWLSDPRFAEGDGLGDYNGDLTWPVE